MDQRTVNLPIYFHPDARIDALEAYFWYEERSNEVGQAFRSELDAAVKSIAVSPESWPSYLYSTQRFVMKRFPFAVIYRIANTRIDFLPWLTDEEGRATGRIVVRSQRLRSTST